MKFYSLFSKRFIRVSYWYNNFMRDNPTANKRVVIAEIVQGIALDDEYMMCGLTKSELMRVFDRLMERIEK